MPENKTLLANFESLFEPLILQRARNYWHDGAVSSVDEPTPHLYHASIEGSGAYDVDVRIAHGFIMSAACTCPYERTRFCKHIGALLYELRENPPTSMKIRFADSSHAQALSPEATPLPHELADEFATSIAQWKSESSFNLFLSTWDTDIEQASRLDERRRSDHSLIDKQGRSDLLETPLRWMQVTYQRDTFSSEIHPFYGLEIIVENAVTSTQYEKACKNIFRSLTHAVIILYTIGDPHATGYMQLLRIAFRINCFFYNISRSAHPQRALRCLSLLERFLLRKAIRKHPVLRMRLACSLTFFALWKDTRGEAFRMLARLREYETEVLLSQSILHSGYDSTVDPLAFLELLELDMLQFAGNSTELESFVEKHSSTPSIAFFRVVTLFEEKRFHELTAFVENIIASFEGFPSIPEFPHFEGLLEHGWYTVLEACAQADKNRDLLSSLYQHYIIHGRRRSDVAYVSRLQMLLSREEWNRIVPQLAADCSKELPEPDSSLSEARNPATDFRRNPAYEQLIVNESLSTDALEYSRRFAVNTLPLLRTIVVRFPQQARDMLLSQFPEGTLGISGDLSPRRVVYQRIVKQLRRYKAVLGVQEMKEVAQSILTKHPTRLALHEEVDAYLATLSRE